MLLLGDRAGLGALKLTQAGDGMPLERRVMRPLMLQTMCADKWNTDFRLRIFSPRCFSSLILMFLESDVNNLICFV